LREREKKDQSSSAERNIFREEKKNVMLAHQQREIIRLKKERWIMSREKYCREERWINSREK
jgi:hypothetical protein